MPRRYLLYPMAASIGLACIAGAPASAEVWISGTQDNVVLQAKDATIGEIVSSIKSVLKVEVGLTGSTPRQFTGTYEGSLRHVLSRLLDGDNYFISAAPDGMKIVLVGPKGSAPSPHGPAQRDMPVRAAAAPVPAPKVAVDAAPENGANQARPPVPNSLIKSPVPVQPIVPPRTNSVDAGKSQSNEADGNPDFQRSAAGGRLVKHPVALAPAPDGAGAVAKPQTEEAEGNPYFQGSASPGQSIIKHPIEAKATKPEAAPIASAEDEGNPNFQGYKPDWTPPWGDKSGAGAAPPPRPTSGERGQ
jgi:hypothetical protein